MLKLNFYLDVILDVCIVTVKMNQVSNEEYAKVKNVIQMQRHVDEKSNIEADDHYTEFEK